ncbi:hypothetical protein ABZ943_41860, partial [Streptomyces rubiginosohelvolus]
MLFAADGFFSAALAPGATPPATTALPAPPTTGTTDGGTTGTTTGTPPAPGTTTGTSPVPGTTTGTSPAPGTTEATPKPPAHRTHATPPWLPPADATGPRHRLDRDGVLTAPDGATYTQGTPAGRGNGFFGALSSALRDAAGQPGRDRSEAVRLRNRADLRPAKLMRLNGLPGDRADRDALFSPPPPKLRPGAPAPTRDDLDGHLRRYLSDAPWGPEADRTVAEWAAAATGTTVVLVEENGTTHTYPGPTSDAPVLRLRRRGGDFVPLLPRTPAPAPAPAPETPAVETSPEPKTEKTEKAAETPETVKTAEETGEKTVLPPVEKTAEKTVGTSVETPGEKSGEKPGEKAVAPAVPTPPPTAPASTETTAPTSVET